MQRNKTSYNLINIFFILLAVVFVACSNTFNLHLGIMDILVLICVIIFLHFLKFIKTYLLLIENRIPIKRMLKLYIKTTFVSIALPYKTGELFKMYTYGHETSDASTGIFVVLVDKFFDAVVLCFLFIIGAILKVTSMGVLAWLLVVFVIACSLMYFSFPSTYHYLNKFLINSKQSKKSNAVLSFLEETNRWYLKIKSMINKRQLLLMVLTGLYWLCELAFIYLISLINKMGISLTEAYKYINDSFVGKNNFIFSNYIWICSIVFLVILIFIYLTKALKEGYNDRNL